MAQFLKRKASVQKRGFQDGVSGKVAVNSGSVNSAPGLPLQILIAANMVGVGVGIVDCGKQPSICIEKLANLSTCVLVVSTVSSDTYF